jgi:TPP-dependent pyruvate/acetoin dehydrogenase alpha subunit
MILARKVEEQVEDLYLNKALLTGPCHLYLGMEAIAAGASGALRPDDYVLATYRGHGHAVTRGIPLEMIFAELMGRSAGPDRGIGGSMHVAMRPQNHLILATAIVGSNIPIAAGVGLAVKKKKLDNVVACFFGDGAVNTGAFNEGLNLAAVWKVPCIFVCENNQYAMSLPVTRGVSSRSIAEKAASFNIHTFAADGNDPVSVFQAVEESRAICARGDGPCFVEARTYRMKGHGIYDKALYRPQTEVEQWVARDPVRMFESELIEGGVVSREEVDKVRKEIDAEIGEAVTKARSSPYLEFSELQKLVYP